jgi:hypothetical protein
MNTPGPITRLGAQREAAKELSKSIYHRSSEPWPVRVFKAIGRAIDHALNKALQSAPAGSAGVLALVVVIAVVAALIIWRVGVPRRAGAAGAVLELAPLMSAAEHRDRSEQASAAGDLTTAVIERMRAVARELDERGILEPRASRTASELARDTARAEPALATRLAPAADAFNLIVYGGVRANARDLALVVAADDEIRGGAQVEVLAL